MEPIRCHDCGAVAPESPYWHRWVCIGVDTHSDEPVWYCPKCREECCWFVRDWQRKGLQ